MMMKWLVLLFAVSTGAFAAERTVVVYNWAEYLPDEVIRQFTSETGIRVRYSTFDNNESMYAKVKSLNAGGYDIVVPSAYYVYRMRKENLLAPLDRSRLSNFDKLDPRLLDQAHDPGNVYSVPYLWGSSGIAVDGKRVDPATVKRWADLWKPEFKGRLLLLDDMRDVFGIALKTLGYSANTRNPAEIQAAFEKLRALLPNVKMFNADSPKSAYLAGEVAAGQIWNGEAFMAALEKPSLTYVYPQEGALLWMDNLVIPRNAKNVAEAHAFIDFLLRPEIARRISAEIGYSSPNKAAVDAMPPKLRNNRTVNPTAEDLAGAEFQTDVGDAQALYEQYWSRLKAGR